ncbi:MAG TPA: hypothetical protein VGT60_02000 [Candidatus Limnocylindria bacterium]|nr:hypothetical protein [Candidatus Limnocylindria bacterium]
MNDRADDQRVAGRAAAGLVLAIVLAACGGGGAARLARAADAMEHLRGVRFSLDATSVATGGAPDGDLVLRYRGIGELVPPDRLRLTITEPRSATLIIVGERVFVDGVPAPATTLRTIASPVALLEQLREPGAVTYSGLGFTRGTLTARYRIDRGDRGVVDVELGLGDDLVRRQTFAVTEAAAPDGSGLTRVRTALAVEYWDHGADLRVGEPNPP